VTRRPVATPLAGGRRGATGPGRRGDRGSVTAETAVVLPVLLLAVAAGVWLIGVADAEALQRMDAAFEDMWAARGEPVAQVRAAAAEAAPAGAQITVQQGGPMVTVAVTAVVRPFGGLLRSLPTVHVGATARAVSEGGQ